MKETFDILIDHLVKSGFFMEQAVEILEKGMIQRALAQTNANQSEAAKVLGIHRNTLQRKMTEFGIAGKFPPRRKIVARKPAGRAGARKPVARQRKAS